MQISSLLSRELIILILAAILLATPFAYYAMERWLENFAFQISIHWTVFLAGGLISMLVAAATVGLKIWSAARTNPVESLKTE